MLETTLGVDVLGVVRPEAVQAVTTTRNGRIGLLATPATVATAPTPGDRRRRPARRPRRGPGPDLAPIIQRGFPFDDALVATVRSYVAPLREADVDTVVLGCTHYPLIRPMLQRMLGRGVAIVTSGAALARQVEHALNSRGLANPGPEPQPDGAVGAEPHEGDYRFLCTGDPETFRALGTRFLAPALGGARAEHAVRPARRKVPA